MTHIMLPKVNFGGKRTPEIWVDEAIWGHRLYDEQTPWLIFLEFLTVLTACRENREAFIENNFNTLSYKPNRFLSLRNIVFNNPKLKTIIGEENDDESRWQRWFKEMEKSKGGVETDFKYVKNRFESFENFYEVINLLRSSAIEGDSNKQFTSKFLFPYGPNCIFEDLDVRSFTSGRRFFARTGELAYLMLCRSGRGQEVLNKLNKIILDKNKLWNQIVSTLNLEEKDDEYYHKHAYLPYETLPDYKAFANDWLLLLNKDIPGYDVIPHLVVILGLHMLLYFLRRSSEIVNNTSEITIICEMISPKRSIVRNVAIDSYRTNNFLSREAIMKYIDNIIESNQWTEILSNTDVHVRSNLAKDFFEKYFSWEVEKGSDPEGMLSALKQKAKTRHDQHVAKIHATWTKNLGLASRRGTNSIRYAPTDNFLKSFVYTIVDKRMEFYKFLDELYKRYGIVIGHHEAEKVLKDVDRKVFEENAQRLERRLVSLGLLKRLSDACAYVENPYSNMSNCK